MIHNTTLHQAVTQLRQSVEFYHSPLAQESPALKEQFRTAAIQGFEYSFEIAYRLLRRYLKQTPTSSPVEAMSYRELTREAAEKGWIDDPLRWFAHRENRNRTSHAYDQAVAEQVFASIADFLLDVERVMQALDRVGAHRDAD